jgi:hypothetical protein
MQNLLSSSLLSKNLKIRMHRTIILPVVFYGYETWSLTLMEKSRLRIFEIRLPRSICGRKRNEVRGERRILDNEEFNYLYSLPNTVRVIKSRRTRWVRLVACMWES